MFLLFFLIWLTLSGEVTPGSCLLGAAEPLLNPLWVFLFDGERPGTMALLGGVVVIVTITAWTALGGKKEEAPEVA